MLVFVCFKLVECVCLCILQTLLNAGNKNTPSMHHPRRLNVTNSMVGLKKRTFTYGKNLIQNDEPQTYSWGTQKKKIPVNCHLSKSLSSMMTPRVVAGE